MIFYKKNFKNFRISELSHNQLEEQQRPAQVSRTTQAPAQVPRTAQAPAQNLRGYTEQDQTQTQILRGQSDHQNQYQGGPSERRQKFGQQSSAVLEEVEKLKRFQSQIILATIYLLYFYVYILPFKFCVIKTFCTHLSTCDLSEFSFS